MSRDYAVVGVVAGLLLAAAVGMLLMAVRANRLQASLKKAVAQYRTLFERSPLQMWVFDSETLAFLAVNEAAVVHYGYTADEFRGMTLKDIRDPDGIALMLQQVQEPGVGQLLRPTHPARHRRKDGSMIDVEVTSSGMSLEGREARLTVINDVTARKQADDALRALTEELEERVRHRTSELAVVNAELEAFAYAVSHDLRTPLRALDGFSQALLEDYGSRVDATGQDYLRRIRRGSQRMGELIDALLELSRVSRGALQRDVVDLSAMAADIVATLRQSAPERSARVDIRDGIVVHGDQRLLRSLLENLLANAWKFTSSALDACIEFTVTYDDGRGCLVHVVRDNGAGFDMAYASKLFGAFQRLHTEREFEGTGIGLATAQRVVHRHGGTIWAEGAPGKGASFYFTIS